MKINILIILFTGLFAFSCKKEVPSSESGTANSTALFSFTRNGDPFFSSLVQTQLPDSTHLNLIVPETGFQSKKAKCFLQIPKNLQPGVYSYNTTSSDPQLITFMYIEPNLVYYVAESRFEVIQNDSVNHLIEARFQFDLFYMDAVDHLTPFYIKDGHFKIHY